MSSAGPKGVAPPDIHFGKAWQAWIRRGALERGREHQRMVTAGMEGFSKSAKEASAKAEAAPSKETHDSAAFYHRMAAESLRRGEKKAAKRGHVNKQQEYGRRAAEHEAKQQEHEQKRDEQGRFA